MDPRPLHHIYVQVQAQLYVIRTQGNKYSCAYPFASETKPREFVSFGAYIAYIYLFVSLVIVVVGRMRVVFLRDHMWRRQHRTTQTLHVHLASPPIGDAINKQHVSGSGVVDAEPMS